MKVTLTIESDIMGDTTITTRTNSYTTNPDVARGTMRALINDATRKAARAYQLDNKEERA